MNMLLSLCLIGTTIAMSDAFHATYNGTCVKNLQEVYDFVIVGGGAAGCRIADLLSSEESFRVLLIEAGGVPPESSKVPLLAYFPYNSYPYDWVYKSVPQKTSMLSAIDKIRTIASGRMLGGGSSLNSMAYQRGNREDYDSWQSDHGAKGWGFEDVLKLFKEVEGADDPSLSDKYYGRSGPLGLTRHSESHPIKDAMHKSFREELGLEYSDQNDGNHWGYHHLVSTSKNGRRVSSFNAFLEPNLHRKNLDVLLYSHVTNLLMQNDRAVGVSFVRDGLLKTVRASREVILSAGALRSPQLLMLSGIGNRQHLKEHGIRVTRHLPGVGQNLQDHFGFNGLIAEIPSTGIPDWEDVTGLHQWLLDQTGPFTSPSGLQLGVFYLATGENKKQPDVEVISVAARHMLIGNDLRPDVNHEFYGSLEGKTNLSMVTIIQRPASRGEVRLANADGMAQPLVDLKYFSHPADIESAVSAGQQLVRVMRSDHMRKANVIFHEKPFPSCAHLQLFSEAYFRCLATHHTISIYHPCGTCKIGRDDDPMAVLDEKLRVRGIKGLRVADTSAMPTITAGHLNAPAIMIGSKAGHLILEEYTDVENEPVEQTMSAKRQEL